MQINIRFDDKDDEDRYMWIHKQRNTTKYLKELVDQDRFSKNDPIYLKQQKKEFQEKIREIDQQLKENPEEIKQILDQAKIQYNNFMNGPQPDLQGFKYWCRSNILPKLAKARCTRYDVDDIIKICKGEIDG